jgi:hypothetical protein
LIPLSEPFSRKGYCKLLKILVCDEIVDDSVPLSKYIAFMLSQKKKCKKKIHQASSVYMVRTLDNLG